MNNNMNKFVESIGAMSEYLYLLVTSLEKAGFDKETAISIAMGLVTTQLNNEGYGNDKS